MLPAPPQPTAWADGVVGAETDAEIELIVARPWWSLLPRFTGPDDPDAASTGFWPGDAVTLWVPALVRRKPRHGQVRKRRNVAQTTEFPPDTVTDAPLKLAVGSRFTDTAAWAAVTTPMTNTTISAATIPPRDVLVALVARCMVPPSCGWLPPSGQVRRFRHSLPRDQATNVRSPRSLLRARRRLRRRLGETNTRRAHWRSPVRLTRERRSCQAPRSISISMTHRGTGSGRCDMMILTADGNGAWMVDASPFVCGSCQAGTGRTRGTATHAGSHSRRCLTAARSFGAGPGSATSAAAFVGVGATTSGPSPPVEISAQILDTRAALEGERKQVTICSPTSKGRWTCRPSSTRRSGRGS